MTPEERLNQAESTAKKAPEEAQQAQTIARIEMEIKLSRATMISHGEAIAKKNVVALLEIVDSQAQKIKAQAETIATNAAYVIELQGKLAELTTENNGRALAIDVARSEIERLTRENAEQAKEMKLLRYVLEAEKIARIYEDGTGAAGEALFHARKELEEWDAKTDSKEVAR